MTALLIILLLAIVGVSLAVIFIGSLFAVLYTIPYWHWIRRQHTAGHHPDWPVFDPRYATKLYLAKLTRSAI